MLVSPTIGPTTAENATKASGSAKPSSHWPTADSASSEPYSVLSVRLICLCGDFEFAGCVVQLLILLFPACHGVGAPPLGG